MQLIVFSDAHLEKVRETSQLSIGETAISRDKDQGCNTESDDQRLIMLAFLSTRVGGILVTLILG